MDRSHSNFSFSSILLRTGVVLALATFLGPSIGAVAAENPGAAEPTDGSDQTDIPSVADPADEGPTDPDVLEGSFRTNFELAGKEWVQFAFMSKATQHLQLRGMGTSNVDLIVFDEELGLIAIGKSPRDFEFLLLEFDEPRLLQMIVMNQGKSANWCTLSGY